MPPPAELVPGSKLVKIKESQTDQKEAATEASNTAHFFGTHHSTSIFWPENSLSNKILDNKYTK